MSARRLRAVVCLAAGLALPGLAPAAAPARTITLKASAVLPGSATPRTFAAPLTNGPTEGVLGGSTIVARPDAATLVVEYRRDYVMQGDRQVPVPEAVCVRATIHVGLVTGQGSPLTVARRLLPAAQAESSTFVTKRSRRISTAYRGWRDTGAQDLLFVNAFTDVYVADRRWVRPAQRGQAIFSIHVERLSRSGPCAFFYGYGDIIDYATLIWPPWFG